MRSLRRALQVSMALCITTACFLVMASQARADEERDLIATLNSSASVTAKSTACLRLRIVGTTNAVPVLASLLAESTAQPLQQAARNALEGMPFPEAVAVLRQALPRASGPVKAGLIDSLGWRRDIESIPLLKPLVSDPNSEIAAAAATALGRIGGKDALAVLTAAPDKVSPTMQSALFTALLQCAEQLHNTGDSPGAASVYRDLHSRKAPDNIRIAAWRGLVMTDASQREKLVLQALTSSDLELQTAALGALRKLDIPALREACLAQWPNLPPAAQLALVETSLTKTGSPAAPAGQQMQILRTAAESPYLPVRISAWESMGNIGGADAIPALARAAASAREPAERDTAREALARLRGTGVKEGFISHLNTLDTPEKTEVLRALGDRGDAWATNTLLQNAASGPSPVRLAALDSLRKIAVPNTLLPLLNLAAKSSPDADVQPALRALYAVCQSAPDKEQTTRQVLEAMNGLNAQQRGLVMPVLAELGTPAALEATKTALIGTDPDTVRNALQVLTQWPNASAAPILLHLARDTTNNTIRILALRGCLEVAALEPDHAKRLAGLQEARLAAQRPDEKKLALGKIGQIPTSAALQVATADLNDPELTTEAGLAALGIAEQLAASEPALARETAAQVLAKCKNPDMVKRAWALRGKPVGAAPFIQDWQVAGPYRQPGATGALALFDVPLGPEKPGEQVSWKPVPRADQVNLMALFPNEVNCAAYLRTQVIASEDGEGVLLMGSDDGVKAWLNGTVVHSNNIDRGDLADQDMAPIRLRKGANELLLKITQGGGGWSARARITGSDGQPIQGLRFSAPAQ